MRLLQISFTPYPEVRVQKMRSSLIEAGHQVMLICRTLREPCPDAVAVEAIALPFSLVWNRAISMACRSYQPDAIILRDIPLAWLVHRIAQNYNIPVIQDIADDYAACIRVWRQTEGVGGWLRKGWSRSVIVARMLEKYSLKHSSAVLSVCEESTQRLISAGAHPDHTHELHNTPMRPNGLPVNIAHEHPALVYLGEVHAYRGFTQLLIAMQEAAPWHLHVIGTGLHLTRYQKIAVDLEMDDRIHWHGWQTPVEAARLLTQADVGIIPHLVNPMTQNTQPNKMFEYMAAGLPVISTPLTPISRVLNAEKCGITAHSPQVLPMMLCTLSDLEHAKAMGQRGFDAVYNRYHWQRDAATLLRVVEGVR